MLRRVIRRELEAEFEPRVQAEVKLRVQAENRLAREMADDAQRVLDAHNGVFDRADYAVIRSCLHPDSRGSASDAKLAKAFRLVNEARTLLEKKQEPPAKESTLPPNASDLKRKTPRRR